MNPQTQQNQEELVTITNSKTKETRRVKRSELPDYGLPVTYVSQADSYANNIMRGGGYKPEQVPEEHRGAVANILAENNYTPEDQAQKRKDQQALKSLDGLIQTLDDVKEGTKEVNIGNQITGAMGLDSANQRFEQKKKLAGQYIAKMVENGRLSDKDREFYQKEIMNINPIGFQNAKNESIDDLKETIVTLAGFKPEDIPSLKKKETAVTNTTQNTQQPAKSAQNDKKGVGQRLLEGAGNDIKDLGEGIVSLPGVLIDNAKETIQKKGVAGVMPGEQIVNLGAKVLPAVADEYNKMVGSPVRDGQVQMPDMQMAQDNAIDNPVDTVLNLLPFGGVLAKGLKTGKYAKAADTVADASRVTKTGKTATEVTAATEKNVKLAEFLNGSGPREYIAQNVNLDGAKDLQRTILDKNIHNSMSTKGKIEATQKALTDTGMELDKKLKQSPERVSSTELSTQIENQLIENYGEAYRPVINDIKAAMAKEGQFKMGTNDMLLDMVTINKMKSGLMEYGLRSLRLGETGKAAGAIAEDAARVLRELVATKVPEATPLLRDYRNLRVYMEILPDSAGVKDMGTLGTLVNKLNFVLDAGKGPLNKANQMMYNKKQGQVMPDIAPAPTSNGSAQMAVASDQPLMNAAPVQGVMPDMVPPSNFGTNGTKYIRDKRIKETTDPRAFKQK